jgi:hypothetical protein
MFAGPGQDSEAPLLPFFERYGAEFAQATFEFFFRTGAWLSCSLR